MLSSGLGIGTTPAALIQHGIDTTIVEIDPIVYKFALQYFQFPRNHTAVIDNAVTFVETAQRQTQQYDYIVHDVFTGGVEPVELFTLEFMQGLYALLKDDGIVAIVSRPLFSLLESQVSDFRKRTMQVICPCQEQALSSAQSEVCSLDVVSSARMMAWKSPTRTLWGSPT